MIDQSVGRLERITSVTVVHKKRSRCTPMDILPHGEPHIGVGRPGDAKGWYQQLRDWWAAHKASRREARLTSILACWDSRREVVIPCRAEAAPEMAAAQHALSVATMLYGLGE
jgi:hypothetical protein